MNRIYRMGWIRSPGRAVNSGILSLRLILSTVWGLIRRTKSTSGRTEHRPVPLNEHRTQQPHQETRRLGARRPRQLPRISQMARNANPQGALDGFIAGRLASRATCLCSFVVPLRGCHPGKPALPSVRLQFHPFHLLYVDSSSRSRFTVAPSSPPPSGCARAAPPRGRHCGAGADEDKPEL